MLKFIKKRQLISICIIFMLIIMGFVGVMIFEGMVDEGGVKAATLIVGSGQTYTKIQTAINSASNGDAIYVWAGTYNEELIISKTVTLIGNGTSKTIIKGDGTGDVIKITSNCVNITGFKIQSGNRGIYISSDNVKISNSNISKHTGINGVSGTTGTDGQMGVGIYLDSNSGTNIINNTIFDIKGGTAGSSTGVGNLGGTGGAGVGIYLKTSNSNMIIDNTISNINGRPGAAGGSSGGVGSNGANGGHGGSATGIYLDASSYNTFKNNSIKTINGGNGRSGTNGIDGQSYIDAGNGGKGGNGALATGLYFQKSGNNTVINNSIISVNGGLGAVGGKGGNGKATPPVEAASDGGSGGRGGHGGSANGMYFLMASNNTINNNSINTINGGAGANGGNGGIGNGVGSAIGGSGGRGGDGGLSVGVDFHTSNDNSLIDNIIDIVAGGARGIGGNGRSPFGVNGVNGNVGSGKIINLYTSFKNTINNNNCTNSDKGILFVMSSDNIANYNNVSNNKNNGIELVSCSNNMITGNKCFKNNYAIYISQSSNIIISKNICPNNVRGILLSSSSNNKILSNECNLNGYGISLEHSSDNTIEANICNANNLYGIIIDPGANHNKIINNTCNLNKRTGIDIYGSNFIKLFNNTCLNNSAYGMYLSSFDKGMILNNTCNNNNYHGISLSGSDDNVILDNTCNSNLGNGIMIWSSDYNDIRENICNFNKKSGLNISISTESCIINNNSISNNNLGLYFSSESNINHIYHNNIISNTKQAVDYGSNNNWNNSQQEGNYWSDYTGLDNGASGRIKGDGIGDTNLKHLNLDNYPFINRSGWLIPDIPILYDPGDMDSNGCYEISWKQNIRTVGYILEEDTSNTFNNPTEIYNGIDLNFQIINKPNGTYYYRIIAYGEKNDRKFSNIEDIIVDWLPDIPRNLTVVSNPHGNSLNLSWDLNFNDTKEYILEFKNETMTNWEQFDPFAHPISTYNHTGLHDGVKYDYHIKARDHRDQVSNFSIIISGIPQDLIPPAAPTGLKVTTSTKNSITLDWNPNNEDDHIGYNIYRNKLSNPTNWGEPLDNIPQGTEEYLDVGLTEESTYYYVITAFDEVPNESNYSNIASGTTNLGLHKPFINNSVKDFSIPEDTIDDSTIKLYDWFKDVNNDVLEFSCRGNENISVTIYQENGTVILIPKKDWSGQELLIFSANDSVFEISDKIEISIIPVNDAPTNACIMLPEMTYYEGKYQPAIGNATDVDIPYGDELIFTWFSNVSGEIGVGQKINLSLPSGYHRITINVSDLEGSFCETSVEIQIFTQDNGGGGDSDDGPNSKLDSDGDSYLDSLDAFPNDPTQWLDSDGDNYGDNPNGYNPDAFPNDPSEWNDTDGDNYGDNIDEYPLDSKRWKKENEPLEPNKVDDNKGDDSSWLIGSTVVIIILIVIILLFLLLMKRKKKSKVKQEPQPASETEKEIQQQLTQKNQEKPPQPQQPHLQATVQPQQTQVKPTSLPKQSFHPQQKNCTTCGSSLKYYQQNDSYYCHKCQKYE